MNLIKIILLIIFTNLLISCADYKTKKSTQVEEKTYYTSNGFALIYSHDLYVQKVINKKLNNKKIEGIIVGKAIYDGDIQLDELAKEIDA